MRVLHILNELNASGAETMLRVAFPFWNKQAIESDVLSTGSSLGTYATALQAAGYQIYHIPVSPFLRFIPRAYRLLKSRKYNAIHIHAERASFWYALLAYVVQSDSTVRTVHSAFQVRTPRRIMFLLQRWI